MKFKTQEDAIHFVSGRHVGAFRTGLMDMSQAEKQGWNYHVDKAHKERIPPKSYGKLMRSLVPTRSV